MRKREEMAYTAVLKRDGRRVETFMETLPGPSPKTHI